MWIRHALSFTMNRWFLEKNEARPEKRNARKSRLGRVFYVQELKVYRKPRAEKRENKTQPFFVVYSTTL